MINLQVIPIMVPYDSGNSAPMTDSDVSLLLGVWVVFNIWWIISWIITGVKYLFCKYPERFELAYMLDIICIIVWFLIGIIKAGEFIAKIFNL